MRSACDQQGENVRQCQNIEQEDRQQFFFLRTYDIYSIKLVTRKFHVAVVEQQRETNVQKNVQHN